MNLFRTVYNYRYLIFEMTKREIARRYRGSALGFLWSFLNPLFMLAVYTFVFSVVFKARWGESSAEESRVDFAITLFAGLIIFNILAEVVNQSPHLIVNNINLVKKVIFPLEVLPIVTMGSVLFHGMVSLMVLLLAQLILKGYIPSTVIYFPVILLPLLFIALGLSWLISGLTVYIRDVAQITNVLMTILLFVSAVFFPISALPEKYRVFLLLNPVAVIISESRKILIFGSNPDWFLVIIMGIIGFSVSFFGYWWFQKSRKGFADVL